MTLLFLDLVKMILSKLEKPCYGSSLARIAVEVGEEEDIRLLVNPRYPHDEVVEVCHNIFRYRFLS